MMKKRNVLIAAIGTSPAVLTETVWALAHATPPVLLDEIAVVTTSAGKANLIRELLTGTPTVWEGLVAALRKDGIDFSPKLRFGLASIVVIPDEAGNEATDLRSAGDNMRAADTMLSTLRKYIENPETVVYASIAGGRKTMSALMLSCMSLLGRDTDRVNHVLTDPEVAGMTSIGDGTRFHYPIRGVTYEYRGQNGKQERIASDKIRIELFEVPFVRMRGWFQEKFATLPPSYGTLVSAVQDIVPAAEARPPLIEFDVRTGRLKIGGIDCPLGKTDGAMAYVFLKGISGTQNQCAFLRKLSKLRECPSDMKKTFPPWLANYLDSPRSRSIDREDTSDLSKMANQFRKSLGKRLAPGFVTLVCPTHHRGMLYDKSRISITSSDALAAALETYGNG